MNGVDASQPSPDAQADAADAAVDGTAPLGPWSTPTLISAASTGNMREDFYATLSSDKKEMFFISTRNGNYDIWTTTRFATTDPWGAATHVPELSVATIAESGPELSADGKTIWFARDLGASTTRWDIYVSTRSSPGATWTTPQPVAELNTTDRDRSPQVTADGKNIYFSRDNTGDLELWTATWSNASSMWINPHEVNRLNATGFTDDNPTITDDELEIYFDSTRDGSLAIYRSTRVPGGLFEPPQAVPELAGASYGEVSGDGRYMIVSMNGSDGATDLYETSR